MGCLLFALAFPVTFAILATAFTGAVVAAAVIIPALIMAGLFEVARSGFRRD